MLLVSVSIVLCSKYDNTTEIFDSVLNIASNTATGVSSRVIKVYSHINTRIYTHMASTLTPAHISRRIAQASIHLQMHTITRAPQTSIQTHRLKHKHLPVAIAKTLFAILLIIFVQFTFSILISRYFLINKRSARAK